MREERNRLVARADDTRQLLGVMTESKEVATKLVKSHIIRADNFQKELESLKEELASKLGLERKVKELTVVLEATQEQLKEAKKVHSKRPVMVDRSISCDESCSIFSSPDSQDTRRNVDEGMESKYTKAWQADAMTDSAYQRELELDEAFQTLHSDHTDDRNDASRIKGLEDRLFKLHEYLRTTEKSHYRKIKEMQGDILSLRSSAASSDIDSVTLSKDIDAGQIKFQGKIQTLDCSIDSENSLRFLDYDVIGKELSKSNHLASTKLKEEICEEDLHSDPEVNQRFAEFMEGYFEKKKEYILVLQNLIDKEVSPHSSTSEEKNSLNSEEIVQNHLKFLADCFPDIPSYPNSIYLRSDRLPNANLRPSDIPLKSSVTESPSQFCSYQDNDRPSSKSKDIQEEPLNLTIDEQQGNKSEKIEECQKSSDLHSGVRVNELEELSSVEPKSDAIVQAEIQNSTIWPATSKNRGNGPMAIDIPSIGTVAALSTAAVVSPVVAMAAVGYGVVKILSGNQADHHQHDNERSFEEEEDCTLSNRDMKESIPSKIQNTVVEEPQPTSIMPEKEIKKYDPAGITIGTPPTNPFHNPQNPFLKSNPTVSTTTTSTDPLPIPLTPEPTDTSTKAAKHGSIKGLQELCKGLFWSTEDLSIPTSTQNPKNENKTDKFAVDSPWVTTDLATVHSRLRELEEVSDPVQESATEMKHESQGLSCYEDNSIRVFPVEPIDAALDDRDDLAENTAFKLTDDGRAIEGNQLLDDSNTAFLTQTYSLNINGRK